MTTASAEKSAGPQFQLDLNQARRKQFLLECDAEFQKARSLQIADLPRLSGQESAHQYAMRVDAILQRIHAWLVSEAKLTPKNYERITLIAQGGYGRGYMNPYSDIDLLFLLPDTSIPIEQAFVKSFLYILWDLNKVDLGHATKKMSEVMDSVGTDLDSTTALLDIRLVAGSEDRMNELSRRVSMVLRGRRKRWFIESKLAESRNRREKFGSSVYLLEPNVKEGEGGLRDIHSLQWLSYVLLGSSQLETLRDKSVLSNRELNAIEEALDFILNVRTALHHAEGRKIDSLSFDQQPVVAKTLGYTSDGQLLAEEKLMKDYYLHARWIDRYGQKATRMLTRRAGRTFGGVFHAMRRKSVDRDFYVRGGELFLKGNEPEFFQKDPPRIMECFWAAASAGATLSEELKACIEDARSATATEEFQRSERCRDAFMSIMGLPSNAAQTIHTMHEIGILADYMPEFKRLFCLVRIDHYHRYTVDEHLIKTLEVSERLLQPPPSRYELSDVARRLKRWDLLNLSLLLHDIGKGEGHGHVLRGAVISQKLTQRMGLPAPDQEVVRQLILQHLKMVHISQRRDLEDPHVIAEMAGTVPDIELLSMLYILTYCDSKAVGPNTWTDWKAALLFDLYRKTVLFLEGEDPIRVIDESTMSQIQRKVSDILKDTASEGVVAQFLANAAPKYLNTIPATKMARHLLLTQEVTPQIPATWHLEEFKDLNYTEITVVAQDTKGLLSFICGALSSKDINIMSLQAFSTKDGFAIDVFQVTDLRGNKLPHGFRMDRLKTELNQVLLKKKTPAEAFPIRQRKQISRPDLSVVKPSQVILDTDSSPDFTILEVKAYDRPGLLYDVTSTCFEQGYNIHLAMITTEAYRVVDVFYITDLEFNKLSTNQIKKLRETLEAIV